MWCYLLSVLRHMKENDSGAENNYSLICVWQPCFIPLAHGGKIKGDLVESVLSACRGVATGCSERRGWGGGIFLARWEGSFLAVYRPALLCLWVSHGLGQVAGTSDLSWAEAPAPSWGHASPILMLPFAVEERGRPGRSSPHPPTAGHRHGVREHRGQL